MVSVLRKIRSIRLYKKVSLKPNLKSQCFAKDQKYQAIKKKIA